jgi:DNA-binding transcriptional LysR family regulator
MPTAPLGSTLASLEAFCRTYETGSFTRAARSLAVTPQATSRSVARLEQAIGVTLFRRTTRSLSPTDAGRRYYEVCMEALALLAAGEREVAQKREAASGRVRISAPTTYGHHRLLPRLGAFHEQHPAVHVEVNVSNRNVDFVRDGYDLAIRMGAIDDRTLVARKLGDFPIGVYASPSYLARRGAPSSPEALADHTCVTFIMPSSGRALPWSFVPGPRSLLIEAPYQCSDDVLGAVTMARAGIGLVQVFELTVEEDLARGTLVEVLAPFRGRSRPFSLLYPRGVVPSRAVRAMIDFIVASARKNHGAPAASQHSA